MPALTSGKVLLTGANGYIAVWVAKCLLEAGFSVRGTVRSPSKATHLHKLFASYGSKFETVVVSDMTKVRPPSGRSAPPSAVCLSHSQRTR